MKKSLFLTGMLFVIISELLALILFAVQTPDLAQDTVAVNEAVQGVSRDFRTMDRHVNTSGLDYVVLDVDGKKIFSTKSGLSESINAAIAHRDTIIDIKENGDTCGKLIVYNDGVQTVRAQKQTAVIVFSVAVTVECVVCVGYAVYLYLSVFRPFYKLKSFAERISNGNLDIPLEMDRHNLFGAFTESFDIMRSELKKARAAEAQAQLSKKELVAKLSHDIKTPVASIKAVSEVGLALSPHSKDKENYTRIIGKADQINTLVTNLFTATLEELQQLTVTPVAFESSKIGLLLENADYLRRAAIPDIPDCLVLADRLRLQQVFDNVFSNSYKYADTEISVAALVSDCHLNIVIEDFGGGVAQDETSVIKEKFKRGSNSANIEGAGLGLYISDYFMKEMHGVLGVENGEHGLRVTVTVALC